jgi:cysteinyl-tRNA synthetase
VTEVPDDVRALGDERQAARAVRDFPRADALRARIEGLGYRVVDSPDGPSYERLEPAAAGSRRLRARDVASVLEDPPATTISVQWLVEGWAADVRRGVDAVRRHARRGDLQYVVADLTRDDPVDFGPGVEVLALEPTGWAAARNAALRRATGEIVVIVDGSIEPTGDPFPAIEAALADPSVGVCGPFGIVTADLREFHESAGPEVDAIEGYLMAFRRDVLRDVGLFDEGFAWYRTADVELSFRIRDAGRRAVVIDVPVTRHVHRTWEATPPEERARLSKRNYNRFLERFRGRFDLLVTRPTGR